MRLRPYIHSKCYALNGFAEDSFAGNALTFHDESWGRCHMVVSKENDGGLE